jgi:hypothetical protein
MMNVFRVGKNARGPIRCPYLGCGNRSARMVGDVAVVEGMLRANTSEHHKTSLPSRSLGIRVRSHDFQSPFQCERFRFSKEEFRKAQAPMLLSLLRLVSPMYSARTEHFREAFEGRDVKDPYFL